MSEEKNNESVETAEEVKASEEKVEKKPEEKKGSPKGRSPDRRGGGRGERGKGGRGRGRGRRKDREEKEFEEELLQVDRVTRVVKGGRRLRFRSTVVIGDKNGRVGFGVDKAVEVPQAVQKAVRDAKKNLIKVPIIDGTIPHEVTIKYKSAKIVIMPAKSGTGIIAGGAMRKIANLAGIEDLLGKSYGTRNRIVTGKAMMLALATLKPKKESSEKKEIKEPEEKKTEKTPAEKKEEKASASS